MNENKIGNKKIEKKYFKAIGKSERKNMLLATISEKTRVMEN